MSMSYLDHFEHLKSLMEKLSDVLPGPMDGYAKLHIEVLKEGSLSEKVKCLISLAIAINARCNGCISYHIQTSLTAGATRAEILETIGVAILMGGGPSMVYGCEALEALEQFELNKSRCPGTSV